MDTRPTDLRTIERTAAPHDALLCPPDTCRALSDGECPLFDVPATRLLEIVRRVVAGQPRTEIVAEAAALAQVVAVQRSRLFRFPDTVWVQVLDLGPESAVIIYSRANAGYWDLGVNRRRAFDWLARMTAAVAEAAHE